MWLFEKIITYNECREQIFKKQYRFNHIMLKLYRQHIQPRIYTKKAYYKYEHKYDYRFTAK